MKAKKYTERGERGEERESGEITEETEMRIRVRDEIRKIWQNERKQREEEEKEKG